MTNGQEEFTIMDENSATFNKHRVVTVSKSLALFLCVFFLACIVVTGLLVYHLSSCAAIPQVEEATFIMYDKYSNADATTLSAFAQNTLEVEVEENEVTSLSMTTESTSIDKRVDDVRLPTSIRPHSYKIKLIPFIQEGNFTFHGEVTILINVTESSNNITLHADDLIIDQVLVGEHLQTDDKFLSIKQVCNETKRQFLIIYLDEPVLSGKQYNINIKFRGVLNDLLQGFYRSSYKENNETRWIAITQFQATDARRAFPCFDEPALKAKFQINLARLKNMTSISNMRKISSGDVVQDLPDYVWDRYEESVPMSTYLIAFVISDFEHLSNGTFSVWARRSALSQTKYSLQIGPEILKFYEDFFGIKYPLPKIDMIGLPDFFGGAMENWGLITYRESVLLYEENVSSKSSLQRIAHVVAHELAHQWFGNLVTPVWWSDLWLNEGFATYVECLGADAINPKLKESDQFVINEMHEAFKLDALKSSHQISIPVNNPDEIDDIFDRISYSKGAAIIRMMQNFLSMEVFRRGLHKYLISRMYNNAEQDDLWNMLTRQSHEDNALSKNLTVKLIMDTWTLQTGYPVITVKRDYKSNLVTFYQKRFLIDGENNVTQEDNSLWWVPITYTDNHKELKTLWLPQTNNITTNIHISSKDWLLVNINQTGFYRVNYDSLNWKLIINQLKKNHGHLIFDPKNRAQLIDDSMNLALAGYLDYEIALNVTKYLKQERDYVPWSAAFVALDFIQEMLIRTAHFEHFKNYLLSITEDFSKEIGFIEHEDDDQLTIYSRSELFNRACKLGARHCIINAIQQFQTWKNSPYPDQLNPISENMREVVYCTAINVGGQEEWDFAWLRYLNANVENEKEILLLALGCSRDVWILSRYLEMAVSPNFGIRKHDTVRVFAAVANNPVGQQLAYRYMKTNWNKLRTYLGPGSMAVGSIIRSCTIRINTLLELQDFKNFIKEREIENGVPLRRAQQAIEQVEANVKWMDKYAKKIVHWLSNAY